MGTGIWELVVILLIVLLVFGIGKLPEVGAGLGKMLREFKNELNRKPSEENHDKGKETKD